MRKKIKLIGITAALICAGAMCPGGCGKKTADNGTADGATLRYWMNMTSHASTVFKKQTQEGMLNYITNVRVEKAANLLRTTNLTVKQIAADTGYTSERTFSRAFVKIMGVTPGDFKKNVKEKNRH